MTIAGSREPLVRILAEEAAEQGGHAQATLVGSGGRVSTRQAALVNGAAGHALDYDDVQLTLGGHPSVPVFPALLALAEWRGDPGSDLLTAFVAGFETECRIGATVMPGHYGVGFHTTATVGTFGAAAACAHLLRLDATAWRHALGIAGTEAAGLKSMFGTMCKPLHAGRAAEAGLLAASLAARGFTSNTDALECPQGFAATHTDTYRPERALADPTAFQIRSVLFKFHAACFGTHAGIEAALRLRERHSIAPERVRAVRLRVPPGHLAMCNIQEPRTGLEGKFSLRFTTALALAGRDTSDAAFTDAAVHEREVVALRDRVTVEPEQGLSSGCTRVALELDDGSTYEELVDMEQPESDLDRQQRRLETKFRALAGPVVGAERADELSRAARGAAAAPSMAAVAALTAPPVATR